ncbi:MAG TPA: pantoate--beta-alanine ligase [bacterium]|nr:pantoate--beta-alanine ligase [bacterium]HOM26907.1 pantoate--beta-alanine ligase [bacterium]
MEVVKKIEQVRKIVGKAKKEGKVIGFVPTMGYLHKGHISLIRRAKKECDFVAVSIFVNPTQFGPNEDFDRYPRDFERDRKILEEEKVDLVFFPEVEEMYPYDFKTWVYVEKYSEILEGKFRPGHFKGVCTVVIKLLNIVQPDKSYFGWKDAQQLIIVKKMVEDLNLPCEIIGCETVREDDGLAESSRNVYLNEEERERATCLYRALKRIEEMVKKEKIYDCKKLIEEGRKIIEKENVEIQYLEIVRISDLMPVEKIEKDVIVLGAVKIGNVRLIDNIRLNGFENL